MIPKIIIGQAIIYAGNNLDILPELASNSVDSIVCDPPYELGFMGKTWDNSGIAYSVELWQQCLRVLKPGGHLLAFGGTRTWHRLGVAIEDAGFEIRDNIAWLYGSGFPKSHNISKAIDKLYGAEREVIGKSNRHGGGTMQGHSFQVLPVIPDITAPATAEAKEWDGWGTALKPAFEPIVVARKPLIGTVAENVLKYGTGAINIDASRIGFAEDDKPSAGNRTATFGALETQSGGDGSGGYEANNVGRWPANIILDEHTAKLLDEQSGVSKSGKAGIRTSDGFNANAYGSGMGIKAGQANGEFGNSGGASRFFYVAKANKKDRNEGLDDLVAQESAGKGNGLGRLCAICGASILKPCECPDRTFVNPPKQNFHPTVKPTALMQYLVRLVTPEGGTVLDPFTGSGSTGKAAILEGKQFIGIELTEEYLPIIAGRLEHAINTSEEKEDDLFASL